MWSSKVEFSRNVFTRDSDEKFTITDRDREFSLAVKWFLHDQSVVVSDECELVSVWRRLTVIMQHKAAAIRQVQRCVEP